MKKNDTSQTGESSPRLIDARIKELGDGRGETLSRIRSLIKQVDPGVTEDWKWGVPVWSHDGLICTGETYKNVVKLVSGVELLAGDAKPPVRRRTDSGRCRTIASPQVPAVDVSVPERVCQAEAASLRGGLVSVALGGAHVFIGSLGRGDSCALPVVWPSGRESVVVASLREVAIVLYRGDCSRHIPSRGTAHDSREQLRRGLGLGRRGFV
jgi:hypothetical protein